MTQVDLNIYYYYLQDLPKPNSLIHFFFQKNSKTSKNTRIFYSMGSRWREQFRYKV